MSSPENEIVIRVKLDEKTFKRFARFDMLVLRKRWIRPMAFALILIVFSAVALFTGKAQSGLIAAVLLTVGLGLPLVYIGSFLSQVNLQAMRQRLSPPRGVYTVRMHAGGVVVTNDQKQEEPLSLPWQDVRQAIRVKGCVYLYVSPVKAFLLPDGQANVSDAAVWRFLTAHMGAEKCRNKRGGSIE